MGEGSKYNSFIFICFISITGEQLCTSSHKWERGGNTTVYYSLALKKWHHDVVGILVTIRIGK